MARLSEGKTILIGSVVAVLAGLLASLRYQPSTSVMAGVIFGAVAVIIITNW